MGTSSSTPAVNQQPASGTASGISKNKTVTQVPVGQGEPTVSKGGKRRRRTHKRKSRKHKGRRH